MAAEANPVSDERDTSLDDVAIVGMGCRVPGAGSVDEFWNNLLEGRESISFFDASELDPGIPQDEINDPGYVAARGIVEDCDKFDAAFFGISPAEATAMDPQQRLFMEVSWEALEHAACNKDTDGLVGVFGGTGVNTYFYRNVLRRPDLVESFGEFNVISANDKDYLATRMSYKLDLRGPSINVQTACSTSLVAISQAYWSLMTYQCDVALAGGSSIDVPVKAGYPYEEGSMLSADGHCRPFDADANGTLFNSGVGVVVLKRVEDAVSDGDRIYAVIRGAAVNNDGQDKVSFSAPSVNGQADVIRQALDQAGFSADSISYVETHGTATPLGDPIEIEALTKAFRADAHGNQFCGIGSVKGNLGHLVAAAGVTGLIKTALALYHKKIPASINYQSPNPSIDFDNSPFRVINELTDWESDGAPRRAGVSSFGVGGTNAHIAVEEWSEPAISEPPTSRWQLLPLSAKTDSALEQQAARLVPALQGLDDAGFADAAYTLQLGRVGLAQRRFVVADTPDSAIRSLTAATSDYGATGSIISNRPSAAFIFPGQGSQHPNMGIGLYQAEPVFREVLDECAGILREEKGTDLIDLIYGPNAEQNAATLRLTENAQPALFAIEYALSQLWIHRGIRPDALVGHSIGEFVAACLAEVFTLPDAIRVVCQRGTLMQAMEPGAMLSIRARAEDVEALAKDAVSLAAINAPELCVLAGPDSAIQEVQHSLDKREIAHSKLHTSHAFHSVMMEPAVAPFVQFLRDIPKSSPKIPVVSAASASWLTDDEATSAEYWGQQIRKAVRFGPAIDTLVQDNNWVLIEAGTEA